MNADPLQFQRVAIRRAGGDRYPDTPPFHPSEPYPEYAGPTSSSPNHVFAAVRQVFADLGLDANNFGTKKWNPIGDLVAPGARIVVKPNWVLHRNERPGGGTDELITHASVLRAVLEYVWLARPAQVIVGDAPIQVCNFDALQALGFNDVAAHFQSTGRPLLVKDFRRTVMVRETASANVSEERHPMDDFCEVDLGRESLLEPISADADKFRVTMYDPRKMKRNHAPGIHKYLVARDILNADLVINVPKLKTHKKAGVTLALKNLVGINGNKDYLPHHRIGAANRGGDNYARASLPKTLAEHLLDWANRHLDKPRFYRRATLWIYKLLFFDRIRGRSTDIEGGWHGNDTVWRMCLDLNKVLLYADRAGRLQASPQRRTLHLTDGIVAGEDDGPLAPTAVRLGAMVGALNPAAHDWAVSVFMKLVPGRIPITLHAFDVMERPIAKFPPSSIELLLDAKPLDQAQLAAAATHAFRPSAGWKNISQP